MQMDDMTLVSIDDHMVEPPDMDAYHVPTKWNDQVWAGTGGLTVLQVKGAGPLPSSD